MWKIVKTKPWLDFFKIQKQVSRVGLVTVERECGDVDKQRKVGIVNIYNILYTLLAGRIKYIIILCTLNMYNILWTVVAEVGSVHCPTITLRISARNNIALL